MTLFKLFGIIDVRMADILDVLLISVILYYIFLLFRGTRAAQMIFGGFLLILAWLIAQWWELHTLVWMLSNLATLGIIAIVILFQPEIRSALTRIGQSVSKVDLRNILFHASGLDDIAQKNPVRQVAQGPAQQQPRAILAQPVQPMAAQVQQHVRAGDDPAAAGAEVPVREPVLIPAI